MHGFIGLSKIRDIENQTVICSLLASADCVSENTIDVAENANYSTPTS